MQAINILAVLLSIGHHVQRPGLLLLNGVVYIGFGSHADTPPWHGWLLAYNATTLQQVASFNTTPNGSGGAIWESGCAPAADANGNIYVATSNGTFDASAGGSDYGDSVLKLNPGTLTVLDWFSPFNTDFLADNDLDLGSGGTMLLPDQPGPHPHLLVVAGKQGVIHVIDRDNLGHFSSVSDTQIVQELEGAISPNFSTPAYWQGSIYYISQYHTSECSLWKTGCFLSLQWLSRRSTLGMPEPHLQFRRTGPATGSFG